MTVAGRRRSSGRYPTARPRRPVALLLSAGGARENIPFFVVPPRGVRTAPIAVLVSTLHLHGLRQPRPPRLDPRPAVASGLGGPAAAWDAYPHNPGDHPEYGMSTYNHHSDGSGILHRVVASADAEPAHRLHHLPASGAPRLGDAPLPRRHPPHRMAGRRRGYAYDIVTDQELHDEGVALLRGYPVVTTGSHPEYHTRQTLDALQAYRDGGGRLCYLGGNGFYWKVALSPERRGVIEIRRGGRRHPGCGRRSPGSTTTSSTASTAGCGGATAAPRSTSPGSAFTAQGPLPRLVLPQAPGGRRSAGRVDVRRRRRRDFGDHGLGGHGAAGFELDRADKRLGTPLHAVVVASSGEPPADAPWVLVPEEHLTHTVTWPGEPAEALIRRRAHLLRDPEGRCGVLHRLHHILRQPAERRLRQRRVAAARERAGSLLDPTPFEMPEEAAGEHVRDAATGSGGGGVGRG